MPNVDWDKIKAEYLQGGTSHRKLADKYGISSASISRRATKENWSEQRSAIRSKAEAKVQREIVSQRARDIEALDRTRSMLIARLEQSVSKFPDIPGNRMEQSVTSLTGAEASEDRSRKKVPGQKTVRVESDLLKMVAALEKLTAMSGYDAAGQGADVPVLLDWRPEDDENMHIS